MEVQRVLDEDADRADCDVVGGLALCSRPEAAFNDAAVATVL